MLSSLVLLLVFEWLWLNNVYKEEKEQIRDQASHIFIENVRGIRDSLFQELLDSGFVNHLHDSTHTGSINIKSKADTSFRRLYFRKSFRAFHHRDTTTRLIVRPSRAKHTTDEARPGSISGLLAMIHKAPNIAFDSIWLSRPSYDIFPLLQHYFARSIKKSELNIPYELVQIEAGMDFPEGLRSRSYSDHFSDKRYAVLFEDYHGFILGRITPQIIFSFILLLSISLAFFLIYQSLQKQRRLAQIKNDFISNVTHELKTPITTVSVAIEALKNFNALQDPERTKEYLQISQHELARLSILVDRVLKMSLFEQSEPELKMEALDMRELIQGILNSMKLQFDKLAANVSFQFSGPSFSLEGDRIHLTSVIYNLIDNALKYSPTNPDIQINLQQLGQQVKLSVQDHGMGISQAYQHKIFDKFFRVPTGDQHNIKGHGLGLSYVASVIGKHKGSISVDSQLGRGTCFTIYLPQTHHS